MKKLKLCIFKFSTLMLLALALTGGKKEAKDVTEGEMATGEKSLTAESEPYDVAGSLGEKSYFAEITCN
jgi:hypothetical protein